MEKLIYPIQNHDDQKRSEFTTIAGITYACYFVSAKEIFSDYPDIADVFYSFNLDVVGGNNKQQATDERIGITVAAIIMAFLNENKSAVVYLCDLSDGRQALRKRKFDGWFNKFDASSIVKIDSKIKAEDFVVLTSLLVSKLHPLLDRIVSVFLEFNENIENK